MKLVDATVTLPSGISVESYGVFLWSETSQVGETSHLSQIIFILGLHEKNILLSEILFILVTLHAYF